MRFNYAILNIDIVKNKITVYRSSSFIYYYWDQ